MKEVLSIVAIAVACGSPQLRAQDVRLDMSLRERVELSSQRLEAESVAQGLTPLVVWRVVE